MMSGNYVFFGKIRSEANKEPRENYAVEAQANDTQSK